MIKGKKFNNQSKKPHILITPLDWGLGHVTRCIPIIKELIRQDCKITVAVSSPGFLLLKKELPDIEILQIPGYKIQYSREKKWLLFKITFQLPKIIAAILKEHAWLKKMVKQYDLDAVISDNRLGMYNSNVVSIYITHQLEVKTLNYFSDKMATLIHNAFIKKYNQCWVPDFKDNRLTGQLSHPKNLGSNIKYIGPLSRFEKLPGKINYKYDVLISISGPEPQREIFENLIFNQLKSYNGKAIVIRGLPSEMTEMVSPNNSTKVFNHLTAADLNRAFQESKIIICRSGYTTIMDLVKIGKQAILVPTPGQTEQEYLAKYLMEKRLFFSIQQQDFLLSKSIIDACVFPFANYENEMEGYKKVVAEFVLSLKQGKFAI